VIRKARVRVGLSQEELAFRCGLHRTYISQLERGLKSPSLRVVLTFARVLELPADKLVREVVALCKDSTL
jgi:transcriptional regulator with XRE-family HTH domain